jgi:hypothetical protein
VIAGGKKREREREREARGDLSSLSPLGEPAISILVHIPVPTPLYSIVRRVWVEKIAG